MKAVASVDQWVSGFNRLVGQRPDPVKRGPLTRLPIAPLTLALLALAASALFAGPAAAQFERFAPADLTGIKVEDLSNAVRITLQASGTINLDTGPFFRTAWGPDPATGHWHALPIKRVALRMENCRSKMGAFYNVAHYPVSHVEIEVPTDDQHGIGITPTIVLYRPATCMGYLFWGYHKTGWDFDGLGYDMSLSPDKRSIYFTVMSDRFPPKPTVRVTPGPGREERLSLAAADGKLAVSAHYVPLRRLLDEVAAKTGERILLGDGIERTASMHLEGVTTREFLSAVANTYGLVLTRVNGEFVLGDAAVNTAPDYALNETRRFPLKYLSPSDAVELLPNFLVGCVHPDAEGNALVATGSAPMLDKIGADLASVDVEPPQIEVEATAVEADSTRDLQTAFEYGAPVDTAELGIDGADATLSFHRTDVPARELLLRLNALAQRGRVRVRAQPRATVLNGRTANLFAGQQRYITIIRRRRGTYQPFLTAIPIGVTMDVTPWTGGGDITLQVRPEVTSVQEIDRVSGAPVVGVSRCSANVRLRPGESLIVSGLQSLQQERRARKIPILGDIPLLGTLFSSTTRMEAKSETVVLVTARIL